MSEIVQTLSRQSMERVKELERFST